MSWLSTKISYPVSFLCFLVVEKKNSGSCFSSTLWHSTGFGVHWHLWGLGNHNRHIWSALEFRDSKGGQRTSTSASLGSLLETQTLRPRLTSWIRPCSVTRPPGALRARRCLGGTALRRSWCCWSEDYTLHSRASEQSPLTWLIIKSSWGTQKTP